MTSPMETGDVTDVTENLLETTNDGPTTSQKDNGDSLHKRRRGEPPASLAVKTPTTPSDAEGSSPYTAGLTPDEVWLPDNYYPNTDNICDVILKSLKDKNDVASSRAKELATRTKNILDSLNHLERLLELLEQVVNLKEHNSRVLRRLREVNQLKRMYDAHKQIELETKRMKAEGKQLQMINEAFDTDFDTEYSQGESFLEHMLSGSRSMKRSGSKWKSHPKFGGSLLRKQRSRSAGGEDSELAALPLRRLSEGVSSKEVDKSKVSKWTRVKAAFRWEKAQWPPTTGMGGAAGAVAAGALVGAVAMAGSAPVATISPGTDHPRDSASLTPGSLLSLTPNSSCEELRMDSGYCRKGSILRNEDNEHFLQAPTQDDSSTSPSPNKLHKSAWGKMRDIIQTRRESVRKKAVRSSKSSPDVVAMRRRSLSDGGDSDAPPALTLTIPSSEELESEPSHPILRKQRSLELGAARPPQHRPPRASKWSKVKRAFLTSASASVPSSPNRHSAFFTDAETEGLSSGCEASGVKDEIARDYAALQSRLRREFSDRRGKLYSATRPVATEEQLSADFRKKLAEWQKMKGGATRQPPPVPNRQDLSEDFLKKWDDWKRMKETNSVPAWGESKPDEVLVQTSTGLFKFQGISRSFTRKLHEWEKSRGIKPEASTSALLRDARARGSRTPAAPLTRAQSDGSVAPSVTGSGRLHASSLSVNDADDFDIEYHRDNNSFDGEDVCDGDSTRGAVLVEVEAEEVCTAAPLVAVSPKHTPQKPVYTYGHAEARLLCETSSAITGTAIVQPNASEIHGVKSNKKGTSKPKSTSREQFRALEKNRKKLSRQPSLEEDAQFIRKTIEEIEKGTSRTKCEDLTDDETNVQHFGRHLQEAVFEPCSSKVKGIERKVPKQDSYNDNQFNLRDREAIGGMGSNVKNDEKIRESEKGNGKKKTKSRARLEREQSKPSESDTELDVDTVTVEIPKRRKKPRRMSDKPRTPPTSILTDSDEEVYVLKLKAPEPRDGSPEVIVRTTRKIFSPVVRSGESIPRAVIPLDVDYLADVRPSVGHSIRRAISEESKKENESPKKERGTYERTSRVTSSGDLLESDDHRPKTRPPLPSSPSAQRRPQTKDTAPSIRIMIQRYNMKIKEEEGHTSGASSGTSSPAWRSPAAERRRPLDMPAGVNIRNNPFLEREVQKSVSACQLSSKRERNSCEKQIEESNTTSLDGVIKSLSACTLHSVNTHQTDTEFVPSTCPVDEESDLKKSEQDVTTSQVKTENVVPDLTLHTPDVRIVKNIGREVDKVNPVLKQPTGSVVPNITKVIADNPYVYFGRSISAVETPRPFNIENESVAISRCSERAKRIREAREKFLASPGPSRIRRQGTGSASDLRPGDRSSRISYESDVTESSNGSRRIEEGALGRSASTGMVNVDRESWERVTECRRKEGRPHKSRFSLSRLAAKLRRKDDGAVSRLCRQSLLVQLKK